MDRTKQVAKRVDDPWSTRRRDSRCQCCARVLVSLRVRAAGAVAEEVEDASAHVRRSRKVERASSCTWVVEHCASKPDKWDDKPTVLSWPRLEKRCVNEERVRCHTNETKLANATDEKHACTGFVRRTQLTWIPVHRWFIPQPVSKTPT